MIKVLNHGISYFNEINLKIESEYFITDEMILAEIKFLKSLPMNKKTVFPETSEIGKVFAPKKKPDCLEELITQKSSKGKTETTAWIKFEGFSDQRRSKNDTPLNINLNSENFYRTHFPKKPVGYKDGDIIFIARNSWDRNGEKSPIIFGYGFARKFDKKNVMSKLEQEKNENIKRWPYYIYVENFRFIKTRLLDGISLLDLLKDIGNNTYPSSKKQKIKFEELKKIHKQKDKLKITDEAKDYLLGKINSIL
jgi:hypothetical protein